jgi:cell division protein FtsW (lipid II flippase)
MHLPTRRQEQTAAAPIALTVVVLTLVAGLLVSPALGASILFFGILVVFAYIELTNWLLARKRSSS